MKQFKIKIPKDTWAIPGVIFSHAFYLGYWRNEHPDFTKEYMYLWEDGEITFSDVANIEVTAKFTDSPFTDFTEIEWSKFLLLRPER